MGSFSVSRRQFLKKSALAATLAASGRLTVGCSRGEMDLIFRDARIYDGLGGLPRRADLGVRGDRIAAIGDLSDRTARRVVDCHGLALSPGFIDVHAHTDIALLVDGRAQSKVQQGVTTEISGNCGDSPFPLRSPRAEQKRRRWRERFSIEASWQDAAGFFEALEKNGIGYNYASLVGHGTLRAEVVGLENRPPSADEMDSMRRALEEALEQGVLGLSTGLEYSPGAFATTDELVLLCNLLPKYEAIYATHMRNEDVKLIEAVEEALEIGRRASCSVQISHLKACQQRNWPLIDMALSLIRQASGSGLNVHDDRYPYTAYGTTAQVLFPMWAREGGDEAFVARLKENQQWEKMKRFSLDKVGSVGGWSNVLISRIPDEEKRTWQGENVRALAERLAEEPLDFLRQLLIEEKGDVSIVVFAMSEENLEKVLAFPLTMIGSDGEAISPEGVLGRSHPHPRYYGSFPRVLGRYVRDRRVLSLEEAIHRMTTLPAEKFGFSKRGSIQPGYFADLVLFNPDKIADRATFADPHEFPVGIEMVVVNGTVVVENGKHTGSLPGRILRRAA